MIFQFFGFVTLQKAGSLFVLLENKINSYQTELGHLIPGSVMLRPMKWTLVLLKTRSFSSGLSCVQSLWENKPCLTFNRNVNHLKCHFKEFRLMHQTKWFVTRWIKLMAELRLFLTLKGDLLKLRSYFLHLFVKTCLVEFF